MCVCVCGWVCVGVWIWAAYIVYDFFLIEKNPGRIVEKTTNGCAHLSSRSGRYWKWLVADKSRIGTFSSARSLHLSNGVSVSFLLHGLLTSPTLRKSESTSEHQFWHEDAFLV